MGRTPSNQGAPKRQKVHRTNDHETRFMKISAIKEELHSYRIGTDRFVERYELEDALTKARDATGNMGCHEKNATNDGFAEEYPETNHYSMPYSMQDQRNSASEKKKCEHCNYPLSKHKAFFNIIMCKMSGKYKCGCGRWFNAMALKIQNKAPTDGGAFPPYTFPDCMNCKDNSRVALLEHGLNESTTNGTSGRGHQHDLCALCKKGMYCPRAAKSFHC